METHHPGTRYPAKGRKTIAAGKAPTSGKAPIIRKRRRNTTETDIKRRNATTTFVKTQQQNITDAKAGIAERLAKDAKAYLKELVGQNAGKAFERSLKPATDFKQAIISGLRKISLATKDDLRMAVAASTQAAENYNRLVRSLPANAPPPMVPQPEPCLGGLMILQHVTPKGSIGFIPCTMIVQLVLHPKMSRLMPDPSSPDGFCMETVDYYAEILLETFEEEERKMTREEAKTWKQLDDEISQRTIKNTLVGEAQCITDYFRSVNENGEIQMTYPDAMDKTTQAAICREVSLHIGIFFQWITHQMDARYAKMDGVQNPLISEAQLWNYFQTHPFLMMLPGYDPALAEGTFGGPGPYATGTSGAEGNDPLDDINDMDLDSPTAIRGDWEEDDNGEYQFDDAGDIDDDDDDDDDAALAQGTWGGTNTRNGISPPPLKGPGPKAGSSSQYVGQIAKGPFSSGKRRRVVDQRRRQHK